MSLASIDEHFFFTVLFYHFCTCSDRQDGDYLVRTSKDGREYILSIVSGLGVLHYKMVKRGKAVTVQCSGGDRPFNCLEDVIRFYKVHDADDIGGTLLRACIPLAEELAE